MKIIDRLAATQEIVTVKSRFLRAVDSGDYTLLASVLAENIEIDFRDAATDPVSGLSLASDAKREVIVGRNAALAVMTGSLAGTVAVHHVSAPEIDIETADRAVAIWPMVDRLLFPAEADVEELVGFGYYRESYVRENGSWKIATLKLVRTRLAIIRRSE